MRGSERPEEVPRRLKPVSDPASADETKSKGSVEDTVIEGITDFGTGVAELNDGLWLGRFHLSIQVGYWRMPGVPNVGQGER